MWWRSRRERKPEPVVPPADRAATPVVIAVTEPLTAASANEVAGQVDRLGPDARVVIDLTGIPSFDSDGAVVLSGLQERRGAEQVSIVGLRQATARLTGAMPARGDTTSSDGWIVRRMRNLVVVQVEDPGRAQADALERPLGEAVDQDVAIVVCDLRGVDLTEHGADALAFASSAAAIRGQELLVVNVGTPDVDRLRRIGLSATTYVASET